MGLERRLSRIYLKLTSFSSSRTIDETTLSDEQQYGLKIIKLLASDSDSDIFMAPISEKYFIKSGETLVIFCGGQVSILNTIYHYDITYGDRAYIHILSYIRRIMERRRNKVENEARAKIKKSLSHVYSDLQTRMGPKPHSHSIEPIPIRSLV